MKVLADAVFRVAQVMYQIAGVFLVAMVLVILFEVVSRALFDITGGAVDVTYTGAIELVSFALLFMVLFSLPHAVSRGQVIVDLFTGGLSERAKSALAGLYTVGFALMGVGMTIGFVDSAGRVAASGEVTQDLLIPLSYIYGLTAAATAVLALRGIVVAVQQIAEGAKAS